MNAQVWLLIEEIEVGSFADGSTHVTVSAHASEDGAEKAKADWYKEHEGASGSPHAFKSENADDEDEEDEEPSGWCVCGAGVSIDSLGLQP
jgi:hypothetical protein